MKLTEEELVFDFQDAIDGFKFDECDKLETHYHGLSYCMKGVDFIIELPECYLFVEVKDPNHSNASSKATKAFTDKARSGKLRQELVQKYRDTFLYRWAENKVDKPIKYICLITFENALVLQLMNELKKHLPEGKASSRWQQEIVSSCAVLNIENWNKAFTNWPVTRIHPQ